MPLIGGRVVRDFDDADAAGYVGSPWFGPAEPPETVMHTVDLLAERGVG